MEDPKKSVDEAFHWISPKGFDGQREELAAVEQVRSHPVLKKLRKGWPRHDGQHSFLLQMPMLCGMWKYELPLKHRQSGVRWENQSLSINMLGHIYVAGRLDRPNDPAWPDMELMLYTQDPSYVFVGGPSKTLKEADSKITLATGPSAANKARLVRVGNIRVDDKQMRHFPDSSIFGNGVYLPDGVCSAKLDSLVCRLLETMSGPQPWGRLARQVIEPERTQKGLPVPSIDNQKLVNSKIILHRFGLWLQADMADILFDWLTLQQNCSSSWKVILDELRKDPNWDKHSAKDFNDPQNTSHKPAIEPACDILSRDTGSPNSLEIANAALGRCLTVNDKKRGDLCTINLVVYQREIAMMLEAAPGVLDMFYKNWDPKEW